MFTSMAPTALDSSVSSLQVSIDDPFLFRIGNNDSGSLHFKGQGVISSAYCRKNFKRQMACSMKKLNKLTRKRRPPLDEAFLDHMDYENLKSTPFVSASRSLLWAVWEAERQFTKLQRKGVEFIIIDAFAVAHHARIADEGINALRLRGSASKKYCDTRLKMFSDCAFKAHEVIISYCIPEKSIVSCPQWEKIRTLLPSWFFVNNNPFQASSRALIPIPPRNGLESIFDRWSSMVAFRFQWLRGSMPADDWASTSRREAATFAFALLSSQVTNVSELSSGERRSIRRFITGAKSISRLLLHWPTHPPVDTTLEESAELENLLLRFSLDKWPKVQYSLTSEAMLFVCLQAGNGLHHNTPTAVKDYHETNTNDSVYQFPCFSAFKMDRCTADNCNCQALPIIPIYYTDMLLLNPCN